MSSDTAIKVENLSKCYEIYETPRDRLKQFVLPRLRKKVGLPPAQYYKEFWALKDVSFEVKKGETVGIIGRNGSGKSTLLQMICGTLNPTAGSVTTHGRIAALLELGSGFNPEFTGRENVYMNASVLGLTKEEIDSRFDAIVEFADIGEFIDQPVKTYSSGMYVRLAFSVAVNVDPEILIVDEALAVGDPSFQAKCMRKFEEFRRRGITIILVSHDIGSILQFSESCVVLEQGRKLNISAPKEAVDAFKKLMVGAAVKSKNEDSQLDGRLRALSEANWASNYILNKEGCEIYGNSKAEILDFGIFDNKQQLVSYKLQLGICYVFKMQILFHNAVNDPIFTITIRDLTGKEITGTNTNIERVNAVRPKAGSIIEVSFLHTLKLAPGNYFITFACSGFDGEKFIVYERLYHILLIEVYGLKNVVGYFDMEASVEVSNVG